MKNKAKNAINNDAEFQSFLIHSMFELKLKNSDLTKQFGVSKPTVNRWLNGKSAPHPAVRKYIIEYLEHIRIARKQNKDVSAVDVIISLVIIIALIIFFVSLRV